MQIEVVFAYAATGLPERAHKPRPVAALSSVEVRIPEAAAADAPIAFQYSRKSLAEPAEAVDVVEHDGRLYACQFSEWHGKPVDAEAWAHEQGRNPGRHVCHWRRTPETEDVLGLRMLTILPSTDVKRFPLLFRPEDPLEWPLHAAVDRQKPHPRQFGFERMLEDHRDLVAEEVRRRASGLLVQDGLLYRETGEPTWILDKRFMEISVGDVAGLEQHRNGPFLPFVEYEAFRLDDEETMLKVARRESGPYQSVFRGPIKAWWKSFGGRKPTADPSAPMLKQLMAVGAELSAVAKKEQERSFSASDGYKDFRDAPYFLRSMDGFVFPEPEAPLKDLAKATARIEKRLSIIAPRGSSKDPFRKFADAVRVAASRMAAGKNIREESGAATTMRTAR